MKILRLYLVLIATAGVLTSCVQERVEDTTAKDSIQSHIRASQPLPSGRFQLKTRHTPAPDIWITLPDGYSVKDMSRMPNDEYYVYRKDDPSLNDPNATTTAVLRMYVGVNMQSGAPDSSHILKRRNVMIAGEPLQWTYWNEKTPTGGTFYERELTSREFFAAISPELAKAPLHLHVFIGGTDSARVEELTKAAQTIGLKP